MIGFFEHQYLSYKKDHLNNLIALAKIDGHMHETEEHLLYKIGHGYGLKDWQIEDLIKEEQTPSIKMPDTHEQKINQLYDLVMMIFADSVVEESELVFCEQLMVRFGFKKEIVAFVVALFDKNNPPFREDWENALRFAEEKYLL